MSPRYGALGWCAVTREAKREVYAWCPYCRVPIPVLEITVILSGLIKRRCDVVVDGDATDYATHLWTHQQQVPVEQ